MGACIAFNAYDDLKTAL